ncbi:toxic anion resistance protein [Pseudomonas aeruginosa]|uniref:toxic anion resistance protein n=1 Tax=Pseudomonas aeruginosa TaxID=287 RepID=UPI000F51EEF2|nr:toxic anion resistance protein [Pseudomonas aeruginosa]MBA5106127.1 toxic anion resistance protein [Pseudomonas aeruginosa]MBD1300810.1 toxic anion resistance protein [Pseudomonas aeruginosa]MBD1341582.1 toxic anion resistance protein [Pseudomonas aeruginosa]MBH3592896.1 toxic anion resistance protein [Pseudomonas aeruginosa]MCO2528503.1 toxic anion resistance protein [Pseudomonas aeruginosa]
MQVQTIASSTLPSVNLSPAELQGLGLNESDIPQIQDVALRIQGNNPLSVAEFGREIADHTSSYADGLLDQVRNSDLDDAGAKLTQVLTVAQGVNVNALLDTRSRIPVLGPLLDRLNLKRRQVLGEFDTTREQIEKLIDEVSLTQTGLSERNVGLEEMYHAVREEYRLLGVHIAAGKQRLGELIRESNSLRDEASNDPTRVQQLSDLDNLISNLDKRIGDLTALQQSALQTLPTIRLLQNNNQQLIDKFATIRTVAIPAWKRGFMLAISLNEQRNSVQLANSIDDATNELLKRNAELLHHNSVETAKANQRLVIDVETLKTVQDSLIQTVEEVLKLQRAGAETRQKAEREIQGMRLNMQQRLTHTEDAPRTQKELH